MRFYLTRKSPPLEQTVFIYIDLGSVDLDLGIATPENSVEMANQEENFSENIKPSCAKIKINGIFKNIYSPIVVSCKTSLNLRLLEQALDNFT